MKEEQLHSDELLVFSRRSLLLKAALSVPVGSIAWRLYDLQVKRGGEYTELSKGNRIRLRSVASPRGIIYDSKGVIMAKNIPSFNLMLVKEDTPNVTEVLKKLSDTLRIPIHLLQRNVKRYGRGIQKFQPFMIYKELTWYQMALASSYSEEFPGVSIETSPRRFFPLSQSGSHVLGYMNRITKSQLKKLPSNKVKSAEIVGQEGIERVYNQSLIGTDGGEQVEVNSTGRTLKRIDSIDPVPGKDMLLTIDSKLQREVENLLKGRRASCILMNPNTGAIKALVSTPGFDPNEFSTGISSKRWKEIVTHPDHPLNNKCIQGMYSPGSTFKMLVAIAGLDMGLITPETTHQCDGHFTFHRSRVHCWKRSGHGLQNVYQALEHSCNIFFYKLGIEIGVDKIHEYAHKMGLGEKTGIDLYNEKSGLIPNKAWKQKRYKRIWYPGETLPVSIGQGYVTTTPLQTLNYISSIANGGFRVTPKITAQITTSDKIQSYIGHDFDELFMQDRKHIGISQEVIDVVRQGMFQNVQGSKGTGKWARSKLYDMGGKTGTTQVISNTSKWKLKQEHGFIAEKYHDHAWFAGFAPFDKPTISAVLLLENGKAGGHAARIVKDILEYYFTVIDPLPKEPQPLEIQSITTIPKIIA